MRTNASGTFSVSSVYLFENASIPKIQQQILLKFESLQSELSFGGVTLKYAIFHVYCTYMVYPYEDSCMLMAML